MKEKTLYVITGPTASGKSALAVEIAERLGTEIISADSRQVFSGIPIVTAMPTAAERERVRHHLIDFLPLDAYYSAARFEEDAVPIAGRLISERGVAVVCGGSMLYVDALCGGIDDIPTVPDSIRRALEEELASNGEEWLLGELERRDPEYYAEVDRKNIKRVFHAVEIIRTSGRSYTSLRTGGRKHRPWRIIKIALNSDRVGLFGRINGRVDAMIDAGLEEEARRVWPMRHLNSLNTVGLKEMFAMFEGKMERAEAIDRIKKNTRVYAKKQLSWWKRDSSLHWLDFNSSRLLDDVLTILS